MGWIHTCPDQKNALTLNEALLHLRFMSENSTWSLEKTIILNVGFTPGSISLTAYRINLSGYEWIRANRETNPNPNLFTNAYYDKLQLILSKKFMGFFMVPDHLMWNYNFSTLQVIENIKYAVVPGNPKDYYH